MTTFMNQELSGNVAEGHLSPMKYVFNALCILLMVAMPVVSQAAIESTTYVLTDHLGSPILATDENGDTLWREDYQPYGTQLTNEDGDNSVGFTGHKDDKALGVTYMQGRWYHQEMGRFLAIDPVGFVEGNPGSFNRYAYTNNNPYKFVDPDGREAYPAYVGPYLTHQYNHAVAHVYKMYFQFIMEETATSAFGLGAGKVAGLAIKQAIKRAAPMAAGVAKTAEARAARDALAESASKLSNSKRPATVTAGYNTKTGEVAARACGGGKCAEDHVVDALGGNKADVRFTEAVRPRTGEQVPVCTKCEGNYGREPFPSGTTRFKSDE